MKQRKWHLLALLFAWGSSLLQACSFTVEVMYPSTPTADLLTPFYNPALEPTPAPTSTPTPTEIPALPTPTLISIRSDTISMLEIVSTFKEGEAVHGLAFTPDGSVLASADGNADDFAIRLWNVVTGEALGTLNGHDGIVWDAAFSPDGELLASVSSDQTAKIWDWRDQTLLKTLEFPGQATSVSFSPDGQSLAVGGVDELINQVQYAAIQTFSTGSWEPLVKFPEYINIGAMAFSPRGGTLVGGGTSANLQVWRASDGEPVYTLNHAHQVTKAAISPDGSTVATATCITVMNSECTDGGVWLWDLPTGKLIRKLPGFPNVVESLAFSADGSTLIAGSRDGTLRFYATPDYTPLIDFTSPGGLIALAVSSDGGYLATGNPGGEVHLWKVVYRP